jgi:hypothetical protein
MIFGNDLGVVEDRRIKSGCFFGFAVKPQAGI